MGFPFRHREPLKGARRSKIMQGLPRRPTAPRHDDLETHTFINDEYKLIDGIKIAQILKICYRKFSII